MTAALDQGEGDADGTSILSNGSKELGWGDS